MTVKLRLLEQIHKGHHVLPSPGDLFAYKMRGLYGFCYVVKSQISMISGGKSDLVLSYFYEKESTDFETIPYLDKNNLLIPPILLWEDCWRHGVLKHIDRIEASNADILNQHCFKNNDGIYVDEFNNKLPIRIEPCGYYGMTILGPLEFKIGRARRVFESDDEYLSLPVITTSKETSFGRKTTVIGMTLSIPHTELEALQLDIADIEDPLASAVDPQLGKWVESGADKDNRHILFDVKPKIKEQFTETVEGQLKLLGIRNYRLADSE